MAKMGNFGSYVIIEWPVKHAQEFSKDRKKL